jgi:hypothetical protein
MRKGKGREYQMTRYVLIDNSPRGFEGYSVYRVDAKIAERLSCYADTKRQNLEYVETVMRECVFVGFVYADYSY